MFLCPVSSLKRDLVELMVHLILVVTRVCCRCTVSRRSQAWWKIHSVYCTVHACTYTAGIMLPFDYPSALQPHWNVTRRSLRGIYLAWLVFRLWWLVSFSFYNLFFCLCFFVIIHKQHFCVIVRLTKRVSPLAALRCVMYFRFCRWRHVFFL